MHPLLTRSSSGEKKFFASDEATSLKLDHTMDKITTRSSHHHRQHVPMNLEPHENDVLMGRGGRNNQHSGNEKLRQFARVQGEKYRVSSKKGKSALSRLLVRQMRELDPPARFLRRVQQTAVWEEVSEETAREKASQVLRDAVSGLLDRREGSSSSIEQVIRPVAAAAVSLDESEHSSRVAPPPAAVQSMPDYQTSTSSPLPYASMPKRRRYSDHPTVAETQQHRQFAQAPQLPATSTHHQPPHPPPPHHHHSFEHYPPRTTSSMEYSPLRRHSEQDISYLGFHSDPSGYRSSTGQLRTPASSSTAGRVVYTSSVPHRRRQDTTEDIRDLLHGDLLDSDIDEDDEPLPLGGGNR